MINIALCYEGMHGNVGVKWLLIDVYVWLSVLEMSSGLSLPCLYVNAVEPKDI